MLVADSGSGHKNISLEPLQSLTHIAPPTWKRVFKMSKKKSHKEEVAHRFHAVFSAHKREQPNLLEVRVHNAVVLLAWGREDEPGISVSLSGFQHSLFLPFTASCIRRENKKEKQVALLAAAELPAKSVDLAAINLTELVNGMLNATLRGTKKLFSLLSITSYSSFAFHKVSVTIYNISNVKNVDPGKFPMHYCYCLNNVTNDLTDFTALLVDIIGNSTSYLTEIFKSTSILSVRQSNDSDCIYICVMTGQTGRNLSNFGEMLEKSPVINYTFSSNNSSDLATRIPLAQKGEEIPTTRFLPWPKTVGAKGSGFPSPPVDASRPRGTAGPPPTAGGGSAPSPALQPGPTDMYAFWMQTVSPQETSRLMQTEPGCPQAILKESQVTSPPVTLIVQKINPCVMELCRFFQLCLCVGQRRYSRKEAMRYCVEYYSWFLKNASYICERVKRIAYSHTLKQKCLKNICTSI
ncbi:PREDICTED: HERV-H LTR-associating protein 1 [Haliaeetus leucocephalus]|uniref:HERV-H LTR-associating protein 1 n=1 Tax=Haliaeetus leucocephalus TaxID=52644 RepID=UPI00053CD89D|nr:PREDICTED: HERV-H LTR-associating protein 1 [Haliaeetus leucocephalus]